MFTKPTCLHSLSLFVFQTNLFKSNDYLKKLQQGDSLIQFLFFLKKIIYLFFFFSCKPEAYNLERPKALQKGAFFILIKYATTNHKS